MPFGLVYGALFFALTAWLTVLVAVRDASLARLAAPAALLSLCLCLGLLARRPWARWTGAGAALAFAAVGAWLVLQRGDVPGFVLTLTATVATVLLVVPASGDAHRGAAVPRAGALSRALGYGTLLAVLALVAAAGWNLRSGSGSVPEATASALPARAPQRIAWTGFDDGLERARSEGKPLLVHFTAAWCGYCKKMDASTWTQPSVIARLTDVVPARIDIDQQRAAAGPSGAELAARYRVSGTPTTVLLDGEGREVARAGGYQTPRQFLAWLDRSLGRRSRGALQTVGG